VSDPSTFLSTCCHTDSRGEKNSKGLACQEPRHLQSEKKNRVCAAPPSWWGFFLPDCLCALCRSNAGRGLGQHPSGLHCWWPRLRQDCLAMLAPRWCRGTRFAGFARCAQTTPASMMTKRASHAHLDTVLLSTNKAPGQMPAQPFSALLVACHSPAAAACHQRGDKSRRGAWRGALLASQARREGQVCPLLKARGWRACLSPKGELRSHLTWTARL
jgi:hypothetical protein